MPREMKDSGIKWIGEIPSHWEILPIKIAFSEVKTKNSDGQVTNALKFKFGEIVPKTNFDSENDDYVADTILNYTVVEPRTIMINGLNLNYDFKTQRTGLVREKGIITSAYLALKPLEEIILAEYATYLFKGYESKMAFHNMGSGIRLTLGFKEFKNQPLLVPPIDEQKAIIDLLATKCAEVDAVIEQTKATIEEYKALKQSIITEAVTKGIRGDRPMKDSGIEWIGEIPVEWKIVRLRYLCRIYTGNQDTQDNNPEGDYPFYVRSPIVERSEKYTFDGPAILMSGDGAGAGRIFHLVDGRYGCHQRVYSMQDIKIANRKYLFYYLKNLFYVSIETANSKSTVDSVRLPMLQDFPVLITNEYEQKEIADYLDQKCGEIDALIEKKTSLLKEMEALKKSIIFEYVTGKKEVC